MENLIADAFLPLFLVSILIWGLGLISIPVLGKAYDNLKLKSNKYALYVIVVLASYLVGLIIGIRFINRYML